MKGKKKWRGQLSSSSQLPKVTNSVLKCPTDPGSREQKRIGKTWKGRQQKGSRAAKKAASSGFDPREEPEERPCYKSLPPHTTLSPSLHPQGEPFFLPKETSTRGHSSESRSRGTIPSRP